ncbi:PAC2 family protein [Rubrobacter indicoceani]|uniref:PAC2 family protein n=1 Tax=Rubrobacter indicoceani TaxID=2051957 RepID=UPI000E5A98B8|nr:PAC2 family protein [Rubrobacter indicoceani]
MENRYVNVDRKPGMIRPVLISAFTGWNDAADASSLALSTILEESGATRFGSFVGEEFFDYQATRPQVKLVEGVTRALEWPENVLHATEGGAFAGRDVILLSGPEPNFRWKSFSDAVVELAKELDAELIVTLGALLADVPHSRPVSVAANSQDPDLTADLELLPSRYEGPTGITGVLHSVCAEAGIPSVSLWASTPHYLPAVPSAPAALAILEKLTELTGIPVDVSQLEATSGDYQEQISAAVQRDSDLSSYVKMLEDRYDSQASKSDPAEAFGRDVTSGDDLARELEEFLREQRDDEQ